MIKLTLNVLGALELSIDDRPIITNFRTDKVRALLIYLALEAGRPHRRNTLAALLWSEFTEQSSRRNLRKGLFYLRQKLEEAAPGVSIISADRQSVELNPHNLMVDAIRFEHLLSAVEEHSYRHLHHLHTCNECLARLVEAESLYRGDLLPGFSLRDESAFEEWLLFRREQLQRRAILALQNLAVAFEQRGDYGQAEDYATRLAILDPYNEIAVRQLMSILTVTGRRNAALQAYERIAGHLQTDLGIEPEEKTSALYVRIAEDSSLELTRGATQLHRFPIQFTPFLGRKEELDQIAELLVDPDCRLLAVIGPGGIGKTRLAIEAAKQVAEDGHFSDGIYYAHLSGVETAEALPAALAITVDLMPQGNATLWEQLLRFLQTSKCLLVLDNFEQLAGKDHALAELLAAAPALTLLVTSRQPLHLRAERVVRIGGFRYPEDSPGAEARGPLTAHMSYDAVHFFVRAARMVRPDFALSAANAAAVIRICRLTQGIPLALEIAAAWVRLMDVPAIAEAIGRSLDFLSSTLQDRPDRQRSMTAVFHHSWQLLTPDEQLTLARASIFQEPFVLATALEVLETTIGDVAGLVDKSLLQCPTAGRYGLHELLRQFAAVKLAEMENGPEIELVTRRKHSDHYLALVADTASDFIGPQPQGAAATLRPRWGNVTQAWRWAVEQSDEPGRQHAIAQSLDGIGRYYDFWGGFREGDKLMAGAAVAMAPVASANELPEADIATLVSHVLTWQAHFQNRLGWTDPAIETATQALARGAQDPGATARARSLLGELLPHSGRYDDAERYLQAALTYYQEVGDKVAQAEALGRMGIVLWRWGRYRRGIPILEEALSLQESLNNKGAMAHLMGAIAGIHFEQGDVGCAWDYVRRALRLYEEVADVIGIGQTNGRLALLNLTLGQYEVALEYNQQALNVYRDIGDRKSLAMTLANRGSIAGDMGNFEIALACYKEAIALSQALDLTWEVAFHRAGLAAIWHEMGNDERARALYDKSIPVLREHGAMLYLLTPLRVQGKILLARGRIEKARELIREALERAEHLKLQKHIVAARILAATVDFAQGRREHARQQVAELLASAADPAEQASLHYELWCMDGGAEHAEAAYELYGESYKRLPKYGYKRRLDELRAIETAAIV